MAVKAGAGAFRQIIRNNWCISINTAYKHTLPSCRITCGAPFSWSVAHYISHYVFTPIWPILCTCWGVIYWLSVYTCSLSSSPPSPPASLSLTLLSISLHLSTCLPASPASPCARRRPSCCQGYSSHCVPGCQVTGRCGDDQEFWSTIAAATPPPPPLSPWQINLHPSIFPRLFLNSVTPYLRKKKSMPTFKWN